MASGAVQSGIACPGVSLLMILLVVIVMTNQAGDGFTLSFLDDVDVMPHSSGSCRHISHEKH